MDEACVLGLVEPSTADLDFEDFDDANYSQSFPLLLVFV